MCNVEFKDRLSFMTVVMDLAPDMLEQGGKISFNLHKQRVVGQGLTYRPQKIGAARTVCSYSNPFLAKSECVGTHLKLCSSKISSPSFTFSVIVNVIHSLTAESQGPYGSECQGGVMSCSLAYGCAASCVLCWKKHVRLCRPPMQIFCVHFLSKIFSNEAHHFLLPFFFFCLHLPLSLSAWHCLHMFPDRVLAHDAA
jgi:hypothetical protein